MIQIGVNSTDGEDIFATVIDLNTNPNTVVLNSVRINHGAVPVQVQVQEDGAGSGRIAWSAVRCNDPTLTKQGNATPSNTDIVDIYAT